MANHLQTVPDVAGGDDRFSNLTGLKVDPFTKIYIIETYNLIDGCTVVRQSSYESSRKNGNVARLDIKFLLSRNFFCLKRPLVLNSIDLTDFAMLPEIRSRCFV